MAKKESPAKQILVKTTDGALLKSLGRPWPFTGATYRTIRYVQREIRELAAQLGKAS